MTDEEAKRMVCDAVARLLSGIGFSEVFPPSGAAGDLPARVYTQQLKPAFEKLVDQLELHGREPEYGADFCLFCDKTWPHLHSDEDIAAARKAQWLEFLQTAEGVAFVEEKLSRATQTPHKNPYGCFFLGCDRSAIVHTSTCAMHKCVRVGCYNYIEPNTEHCLEHTPHEPAGMR